MLQVTLYCMCQITLHPTKTYLAFFQYKGEQHLIFYKKGGVITKMLNTAFSQLDAMLSYYTKVTVIFLQLHQVQWTHNSDNLTAFLVKLKNKLKPYYGDKLGYIWAREHMCASAQHYHMAIFLNGHKCQSSQRVDNAAKECWTALHPDNFSFRVRNRTYRIRNDDDGRERRAVKMRLSYMVKVQGKRNKGTNNHRFGASKLVKREG